MGELASSLLKHRLLWSIFKATIASWNLVATLSLLKVRVENILPNNDWSEILLYTSNNKACKEEWACAAIFITLIIQSKKLFEQKISYNFNQGRIQDFYNGVSISKELQEYIWNYLWSAADNINFTGLYAEVGDLCIYVYSVQSTLSMLILGGLGACSQQKIFAN